MTTYTKFPSRQLKHGDCLVFSSQGRKLEYNVCVTHLRCSDRLNDAIFDLLKIEKRRAFCKRAYGKSDVSTDSQQFPECKMGDYAALTRVARALFAKCRKPTKAEARVIAATEARERKAAEEAERKVKAEEQRRLARLKARLKALPTAARAAALALQADPNGFGCQRASVVKLVSALVGHDLSLVLK